jgi:hypothetical protein
MIIESGADLHTILAGSGVRRAELWIVALDHNLRLQEVGPIATITEPITNHIDDIATAIDGEYHSVAYYALAWSTTEEKPLGIEWLAEIDELLRADPELRGARLLGQIVSDPVHMFTSVPLCDFSLYSDMADLPRAQRNVRLSALRGRPSRSGIRHSERRLAGRPARAPASRSPRQN